MSTKHVRNGDRLQQFGGSDAAFERDPVISPAATARLSRALAILFAAVIAVLGLVVSNGSAAGSTDLGDRNGAVSTILPQTGAIKDSSSGPATMVVPTGRKLTVVYTSKSRHPVHALNKSFHTGQYN